MPRVTTEHKFNKIDLENQVFEIEVIDSKKQDTLMTVFIDLANGEISKRGNLDRYPILKEDEYLSSLKVIAQFLLDNNITDPSIFPHQPYSPFEMESDAPFSLNFLVYIQNAFLNRKNKQSPAPKFPYVDISEWKIIEDDQQFIDRFKEVWAKAVANVASAGHNDNNAVLDNDKSLFKTLFQSSEDGEVGYKKCCKSFIAWWESYAGRIAIEYCFSDDLLNRIYRELSQKITREKRLKISLVYDTVQLAELQTLSWYAVLPLEDIFRHKKYIVPLLLNCCEYRE